MENLIEKLSEILEVESLDVKKNFKEYEAWDSLAILYVISMLDSDYKMSMTKDELCSFATIEAFCNKVLTK